MSDNRTTELRRLLDERGVEHYDGTESTLWLKDEHGYRASADELSSGRLSVHIWCDTPEQAIAATLGKEKAGRKSPPEGGPGPCGQPSDDIVPDAAMPGNGKLTAEQVREAIEEAEAELLESCEYVGTMGERKGDVIEAFDKLKQAIADELNELESGACEPNWMLQGETQTQEFWRCECSNCGECFGVETRESFPLKITIDKVDIPNYCPNCGARIKKAVER